MVSTRLFFCLAAAAVTRSGADSALCNHGKLVGNTCECEPDWSPFGKAIITHEGYLCGTRQGQSGDIPTIKACKKACEIDKACKHAMWTTAFGKKPGCLWCGNPCYYSTAKNWTVYEMNRCSLPACTLYDCPPCHNNGALKDGVCTCDKGRAPSGPPIVEHEGKRCNTSVLPRNISSNISSVAECKQGCIDDVDCKYANWCSSDWCSEHDYECQFSSECLTMDSDSDYTVYEMNRCAYPDASTCSGHGTPQSDGSCICDEGWFGSLCDENDFDDDFFGLQT